MMVATNARHDNKLRKALCIAGGLVVLGCGGASEAIRVEIVEPADGATVTGPDVRIVLQAHGVEIVPAGVEQDNSGHHHLFLDVAVTASGETIPAGPGIVHLGGAQTEHTFEGLAAGDYTLIARLGDWLHVPIESVGADTVRFTIQP